MCVVIMGSVGILAWAEPVQADRPLTERDPSVLESAHGDQKQHLDKSSLPIARHHLHWVDGVVVTTYALGMLGIGWYYNRRQQNVDEYFVGNRSMNRNTRCPFWIPKLVSTFANLLVWSLKSAKV